MSSVTRPRGPLPPRVYWTRRRRRARRRSVLVLGIGKVLAGGSDAKEPDAEGEDRGRGPDGAAGYDAHPQDTETDKKKNNQKKENKEPKPPPLPEPSGPCADSDVVVTRKIVDGARAGGE